MKETITCFACKASVVLPNTLTGQEALIKKGWRAFTVWPPPRLSAYTASFEVQYSCPEHTACMIQNR